MALRRTLIVLALFLALPSLLVAVLAATDLVPARALIESAASSALGRAVTIRGATVFDIVPQPRLQAASVTIEGVGEITGIELRPGLDRWRPRIDGSIEADSIDTRVLAGSGSAAPSEPAASPDQRLFSDRPLSLAPPRWIDGRLEITVARLILTHGTIDALATTATLDRGRLRLDPLTAEVAGGTLTGTVELDGAGEALTVAMAGHGLAAEPLLMLLGRPGLVSAPIDLAIDLRSDATSAAAMAAGLTGHASLAAGAGRAVVASPGQLVTILRAAGLLDKALPLRCAAFDLEARDGVVTPKVAVIRTGMGRITMSGEVHMGAESLDLTVLPKLTGTGIDLTLPVKITGSLPEPTIAVDKSGAAGRLIGLLGGSGAPEAAQGTLDALDRGDECLAGAGSPASAD